MLAAALFGAVHPSASIQNEQLSVSVSPDGGFYEIRAQGSKRPVLQARVAAKIDGRWVESSDYPEFKTSQSAFSDALGSGQQLTTTFTGLAGKPSLVCVLHLYDALPFGDVEIRVQNSTTKPVSVQAIRSVDAIGSPRIDLGAPEDAERVLSDSFSEDRPNLHIYDLGKAPVYLGWDRFGNAKSDMHLAVGSQLVYNRQSRQSLLLGALTSRLWLTFYCLRTSRAASGDVYVSSYTVDSTGTTDIEKKESLQSASAENQIELSLPLVPRSEIASERILFAAGSDYHAQLEAYADAVKRLNHARVASKAPTGWRSWTTYYTRTTSGLSLTNAQWLAEHLKKLGYTYLLIDVGYQYASGEYTTLNATQFPEGMRSLSYDIGNLGLTLGVWTAPFEVSDRAWVYQHQKEWLVHNARGKPIQIRGGIEPLVYVLDTTHPGAQEYLRQTYHTMVREWGVRYIDLDFMDDTAIEGYYYRPNTTALQAQRIGLEVIRKAVGENVLLEKDGSPMLNPVGIVDEGRTSLDTAHSFEVNKNAATGIAARYYMHRNFYISQPDGFNISRQSEPGQLKPPLTLDEAEVSIVLAAVSGGTFWIDDDLARLGAEPDRLALAENDDLLQMIELSRAAVPLDLMSYPDEDQQPSVFLLHEDRRQTMLAVFNWTEVPRWHSLRLNDLQLPAGDNFVAHDVLHQDNPVTLTRGVVELRDQPPHTVRLIKIIDTSMPPAPPSIMTKIPSSAEAGKPTKISVSCDPDGVPALSYHWDFGDGTSADGAEVTHTYTMSGTYLTQVGAEGIDGIAAHKTASITVSGVIDTELNFTKNRRYVDADDR
jgi:hypothetical protein